jgi:hypothetical protein
VKRLLDYDALTHTELYHDYDHETDTTYLYEIQDQRPYQSRLEALRKMTPKNRIIAGSSQLNDYERAGIEREWMHVAQVSAEDQMKWLQEGIDLYKIDKCEWTRKKVYQKLNWSGRERWRTGNARI